jgi:hypothetical protein
MRYSCSNVQVCRYVRTVFSNQAKNRAVQVIENLCLLVPIRGVIGQVPDARTLDILSTWTTHLTASGWDGVFYPKGMRSADYLAFYAEHFHGLSSGIGRQIK